MVAAFGRSGKGDGVQQSRFQLLKAGLGVYGQERRPFFVTANGTVEGVEVRLEGLSDQSCELGYLALCGLGGGGRGVDDVGFKLIETFH